MGFVLMMRGEVEEVEAVANCKCGVILVDKASFVWTGLLCAIMPSAELLMELLSSIRITR